VKKSRRYLLSRFWHYHRLRKLNCRVRNGNGCGLSDKFTGEEAAPSFDGADSISIGCWQLAISFLNAIHPGALANLSPKRLIMVVKFSSVSTG
jgi:hypothetical protein